MTDAEVQCAERPGVASPAPVVTPRPVITPAPAVGYSPPPPIWTRSWPMCYDVPVAQPALEMLADRGGVT